MQETIITLSNGLRIAHKYIPHTRLVHCGYIIDVGGRDDGEGKAGMSHFIEHLIFKGTQKRKTFHILNYIESVGGDLNAYTTKEKTCVYASLTKDYFERGIDVLTDIVFNSIFPDKEIVKERQVIMEEIDMYRDAPDEAIFEDFDLLLFPNDSLGLPILGTKDTLSSIEKADIQAFIDENYTTDRIVFSVVGNVTEKEVRKMADKYMSHIPIKQGKATRKAPENFSPSHKIVQINTHQAHEVVGGRACDMQSDEYCALLLLNNILGGPAMNTRLNLNIREKYGWAYNISSFYSPFVDSGIWGIYYGCEGKNLEKVRAKVMKELAELRNKRMGVLQFSQAQKQLKGQLWLGNESAVSQMLGMGKEILDHEELIDFDRYLADIDKVTAEELQDIANKYFDEKQLQILTYQPNESENEEEEEE